LGQFEIDHHTDPGKVTVGRKAGKRYRIAAQALDNSSKWQPVIWKEEDIQALVGVSRSRVVP